MDTEQNSLLKDRFFFFSPSGSKASTCYFLTRILNSLFRRNELKRAIKETQTGLLFSFSLAPRFLVSLCAPNFFFFFLMNRIKYQVVVLFKKKKKKNPWPIVPSLNRDKKLKANSAMPRCVFEAESFDSVGICNYFGTNEKWGRQKQPN